MKRKTLWLIPIIISGIVLALLDFLFGFLTPKAVVLVGGWSTDLAQGAVAVLNYRVPVWSLILGIIALPSCLIVAIWLMSFVRGDKTDKFPTTMYLGDAEIRWRNVYREGAIDIQNIQILCPQCKISLTGIDPVYSPASNPICIGCRRRFESCPNSSSEVRAHINGLLRREGFLL